MDALSNIENKQEYLLNCVNQMFEHRFVLKECKRLKNKDDIDKMVKSKREILNTTKNGYGNIEQI